MQGRDVMTLFIDEIHKFYSNPQNLADFEVWKERKLHNDDTTTKTTAQTQTCKEKQNETY
jgi:hypothetical protein|nr:MAG TPA: DEXDc-like helicases superfamily [Caudoviricetes sp.]